MRTHEAGLQLEIGADTLVRTEDPCPEQVRPQEAELLVLLVGRLHREGPETEAQAVAPAALRALAVELVVGVEELLEALSVVAARVAEAEKALEAPACALNRRVRGGGGRDGAARSRKDRQKTAEW